jgi:hypothetical protein
LTHDRDNCERFAERARSAKREAIHLLLAEKERWIASARLRGRRNDGPEEMAKLVSQNQ